MRFLLICSLVGLLGLAQAQAQIPAQSSPPPVAVPNTAPVVPLQTPATVPAPNLTNDDANELEQLNTVPPNEMDTDEAEEPEKPGDKNVNPPMPADKAPAANQPVPSDTPSLGTETHTAVLQGLNKVSTRISVINLRENNSVKFGTLEITLKRCWKSPPDERPESAALLEIWDKKPGEEKTQVFFGWMFASSPGLNALEHPVYDVTLLQCKE